MLLKRFHIPDEIICLLIGLLTCETKKMLASNMYSYKSVLRQSSQIAVIKYKGMKNLEWIVENLNEWREKGIHLMFEPGFNQPVENLPASLTQITFGCNFNQPVENLPASLTQITFGGDFNQPVENLPASLTQITFGDYFNQPVENLPASLTQITFGDRLQSASGEPASISHADHIWLLLQSASGEPASISHADHIW